MKGLAGLTPEKAMRNIILGQFGQNLCLWLNRHQKGNRLLMETLTGQPYTVRAVTPQDLMAAASGDAGPEGLTVILELVEKQQKDVIAAALKAVKRPTAAPALPAEAAPAPDAAPTAAEEPAHDAAPA